MQLVTVPALALVDLFGPFRGPGFPQTIKVRSVEPEAQPEIALGRRYPVGFIALRSIRTEEHIHGTVFVVPQIFIE